MMPGLHRALAVLAVAGAVWLSVSQDLDPGLRVATRKQARFGPWTPSIACFRGEAGSVTLDPRKTAIVVANMAADQAPPALRGRVDGLVPRLDEVLAAARELGIAVIHAPGPETSGGMAPESGAGRRRVMDLMDVPLPGDPHPISEGFRPEFVPFLAPAREPGGAAGLRSIHPLLTVGPADYVVASAREVWNVARHSGIETLIYAGAEANGEMLFGAAGIRATARMGLAPLVIRDLVAAHVDRGRTRPWETPTYIDAKMIRFIEHHVAPTFESGDLLRAAGRAVPPPAPRGPPAMVYKEAEVAAHQPAGASSRYRHFTLDWNWNGGYLDDYFSRADPVKIAEFLRRINVDGVVIMSASHHGYTTFQSHNTPTFPSIAHRDFYGEVIRECHARGIAVFGFISLARNWWYSAEHPETSWVRQVGTKVEPMIDLNSPYLDYLVGLSQEVLRKYPLDALRYDTLVQTPEPKSEWTRNRYRQLYGEEMPEAWNEANWRRKLDFLRSATTRAAERLYQGNKQVKPSIEVWQNGFIQQRDFDLNDLDAGRAQDLAYIENGDPFRQMLLTGVLRLKGTIVGHLFNMPRGTQRLCMALGARGYQFKAVNSETLLPDNEQWYYDNVAPFYGMIARIQPYLENARPVPYAGIVYSEPTRYRTYEYDRDWYVYGILKPLSMALLQRSKVSEFISNLDLRNGDFSHLPLIVLPESSGLKPAELEGLRRYAANGGQVLITGEALRYGQRGEPLRDFAMASEMGVSFKGVHAGAWSWRHAAQDGRRAVLEVPRTGRLELRLWMRKSNVRVDQILLTRDAAYRPNGVEREAAGRIVIEAEAFDGVVPRRNLAWRVRRDPPGFGGNGSIRAELHQAELVEGATFDATPVVQLDRPGEGTEAKYSIEVPVAGTYYLWVRQAHESALEDSVFAGFTETDALTVDLANPVYSTEKTARILSAGRGPECPEGIEPTGLVEVRPTGGSTLWQVEAGGTTTPLLHERILGRGRFLYLATSRDTSLVERVMEWAVGRRSPVTTGPKDRQAILTRQEPQGRWILHLISDGECEVEIDRGFAPVSRVIHQYPETGWKCLAKPRPDGMRIHAGPGASDRLLVLQ